MVPGAAKADIWRLAVVWRYGGVYVDSDVVALRPFREVLQGLGL
jgi:mannosyltransferase OCH1-like enzyme